MTPKEVSKELRKVQARNENTITLTGQIRISDMAKDAADAIDSQAAFIDLINSLPTCNECKFKTCAYRPKLGESVRYNCYFFSKGGMADDQENNRLAE